MILRSYLFKRITIVGVGLMGGSLGMAIKKNRLAKEVIGLSNRQSVLLQAIKSKAIDTALTDIPQAIRNADLVVLAAPVDSIIKLLPAIAPHLRRNCVVTDVGSVKSEIVESAEKNLPVPSLFVGSHPLTGSEKKGVENANAGLFENTHCIVTPTQKTNNTAAQKVKQLWVKLGAKVKFLPPQQHDEILAYVSHLPHLLAYGLMETIPEKDLEFASTGLKDTTRIAASSPELWGDICLSNSKNIIHSLDQLVKNLSDIRSAIVNRDQKTLLKHFEKGKENRDVIK